MTTGRIASLREQGFGFITRDDATTGRDLFFHRSGVADDGFHALRVGQRVRFEEEPDPRDAARQRAVQVAPLADEQAS
jgi:cold shock CspA family protein